MSLAVLAQDMASKGRNGDSMLVHMTPGEVAGLQALAMKHGGELTINPDTGLPEANFLKSLLPIIAGFALGPAGFGLVSSGLGAAAAVGGITGLATGSLSKGLMAGLGAYGGFGLGESLMSAGAGSLAATDIAAQQAAGAFPTLAEGAGAEQILKYGNDVSALRDAALSKAGEAGFMKTAGAGFGAIADNPAAYGKDLFKYGMAAASPIMADAMVPTTTKVDPVDTGNNKYPDREQLTLMSLMVFQYFPHIRKVNSALLFLVKNDMVRAQMMREQADAEWWKYRERYARLEASFSNDVWNPNQTPLCGWCPVKTCEFHPKH